MHLIVVGLSHKTASVEVREKLAFTEQRLQEALLQLKTYPAVQESLILSTCNRVEVCAVVKEKQEGLEQIKQFLRSYHDSRSPAHDMQEKDLVSHLYTYAAEDAVRHLFRVASSLDSMMVGEPQILGQLKDAYDLAMVQKTTGVILNKVLKKAISVAKRIRTETKIAESAVSISFAAVELAKKIFGKLEGKIVLLVGAGEMAELAARHLIGHGASKILITTRDYERASMLADQFQGRPVAFSDFPWEMVEADIVLCSTGAPHYLIRYEDVSRVIEARKNKPIFLIDISVPRNIDPKVNEIDNVFLYDIDDLELVVKSNLQERQQEAFKAETIISDEIGGVLRWFKSLDAVPTIVALKDKAEEIRRAEFDKAMTRMGELSDKQKETVEGLTVSIVNKLLHAPMVVLKEETHSSNGGFFIDAIRRLFKLEKDPP
jgi:glutamyl-tRNA reductase